MKKSNKILSQQSIKKLNKVKGDVCELLRDFSIPLRRWEETTLYNMFYFIDDIMLDNMKHPDYTKEEIKARLIEFNILCSATKNKAMLGFKKELEDIIDNG